MLKPICLFSSIVLGILIPQVSSFSFLIYYLLMLMLLFPFLNWELSLKIFSEKKVYYVLLLNLIIGLLGYFLLIPYDKTLAFIAFLVGSTPTATACPAVMSYLKGKVGFTISAVLVTNLFMALYLPLAIWNISEIDIQVTSLLLRTTVLILLPLVLGQIIQHYSPSLKKSLLKFKDLGFWAWVLVCFIAVGKASNFIRSSETDLEQILTIALISGVICVLNFGIGRMIGGKDYSLETSQTLGQKNTTLALWIGLTYFSPLIALGPIFYLIYHNIYNSYQLALVKK